MKKEQDLLDVYFKQREEDLLDDYQMQQSAKNAMLKKVKSKEITNIIENLPEEYQDTKQILKEKIQDLIIDYDVKLAYYNKEYYKQGFYDAVYLNKECK